MAVRNLFIRLGYLIAISYSAACSDKRNTGILQLIALDSAVSISSERERISDACRFNCANLHYALVNQSNFNIVLFNFRRKFQLAEIDAIQTCDSAWGTAIKELHVFDSQNKFLQTDGNVPDSISRSLEAAIRQLEFDKEWFKNSYEVIRAGETKYYEQQVNFRNYHLTKPGKYYLKILYFQHHPNHVVASEDIEEILERHDGYLFNGCLWSEVVELVVN